MKTLRIVTEGGLRLKVKVCYFCEGRKGMFGAPLKRDPKEMLEQKPQWFQCGVCRGTGETKES